MFKELQQSVDDVFEEVIHLTYFMRGSVPYDSMWERTAGERQRIGQFIEKRLESESKSPYPVY